MRGRSFSSKVTGRVTLLLVVRIMHKLLCVVEERFRHDAKYGYRYRDDAQLKRLRRVDDATIEARSLNPGIPLQVLKPQEYEFEILGRVIETPKQQLYGVLVGRFLRMGNGEELPF